MDREDVLEKEIDLIQSCVNRMAQNSFVIKGWLITLITVILALLPEKIDICILSGVIIVATLCFWYLDAYFLRFERLYRWKYEWVIASRLHSDEFQFDLNPMNQQMWLLGKDGKQKNPPSVLRVMFTKSLIPLYGLIMVIAIFLLLNSVFHWISPAEVIIPDNVIG